jgi:hypothetical protein
MCARERAHATAHSTHPNWPISYYGIGRCDRCDRWFTWLEAGGENWLGEEETRESTAIFNWTALQQLIESHSCEPITEPTSAIYRIMFVWTVWTNHGALIVHISFYTSLMAVMQKCVNFPMITVVFPVIDKYGFDLMSLWNRSRFVRTKLKLYVISVYEW